MDDFFKIIMLAVAGVLCSLLIKKNVPEISVLLSIAISAVVIIAGFTVLKELFSFLEEVAELANISTELLKPVYKTVGVATVTKIAVDLCKDSSEGAVASSIELVGSIVGIYMSLPLLSAVLNLVRSLG